VFDAETYEDAFSQDDPEGRAWPEDYFVLAESVVGNLSRFVPSASNMDLPCREIA
jgi:hypothetical protein